MIDDVLLDRAAALLCDSSRVTVLTGAGISVASGVKTFRGTGGLWEEWDIEDFATPGAFARDPAKVWSWYQMRREGMAAARPNPAHEVIANWSRRYPGFHCVTQNIDGLHEDAGTLGVIRFHGSIWHVRCSVPCSKGAEDWEDRTIPFPELPPPCPHCSADLRPAVVWFGEPIPYQAGDDAIAALECEVFLTIGTSALVHPAASLIGAARQNGAKTIEINPEATPATGSIDIPLLGPAEEILPILEERIRSA